MEKLPTICMRCHEAIIDGQETEYTSFVPRWNWSMLVHAGCQPASKPLEIFEN